MRKLLIAALMACTAVVLQVRLGAQVNEQLAEFMSVLQIDGAKMAVIHMNDRTVPLLFQAPTLYAMRAKAHEVTCLYLQGFVDKPIELDTEKFTIEQTGASTSIGTPVGLHSFPKGKVKLMKGDVFDGVLTFTKLVDLTRPFSLKYGRNEAEFKLSGTVDDMKPLPTTTPK